MTNRQMTRAVLFHELGGPEVLRVEEVPLPPPGPGEVLLRVEAIGAGVTAYAVGDPVVAAADFDFGVHGVHAERVVLSEEYLVPRPEGVDAVTAAASWLTYSTAYGGMVEAGGLRPGDPVVHTEEGRRRMAGFIGSGLRDGSLAPVIAETFEGLERITDAHRLMESNTHTGKIVVRV